MKKFEFQLQPVLNLRRVREDQKKREVGVLQGQINEQQRQALEMAELIEEQGNKLKEQYAKGQVNLDWVGHYRSYVTHMRSAINRRIQKVTQIQKQIIVVRQELTETSKQRKIIEKLRDKRKVLYNRELSRQEAREQDEISSNMCRRSLKKARGTSERWCGISHPT